MGVPLSVRVIGVLCTTAILPLSVGSPPSDNPVAQASRTVTLAAVAKPPSHYVPTATPTPDPTAAPAVEAVPERAAAAPNCLVVRCVALTFDDGPVADTARLLSILSTEDVHATFFDVGEMVTDHPEFVRAETAQGEEVGNHSWSHPMLTQLTDSGVTSQITKTAAAITDAGAPTPTLFRPPYGDVNERVRGDLGAQGDAVILWSVDTLDWKYRDPASVYRRAITGIHPGSIVLMHDIHPTTITAVPRIIDELKSEGYTFVTVSELYGGELKPGVAYSGREDEWTAAHNRTSGADSAETATAAPTATPTAEPTQSPSP